MYVFGDVATVVPMAKQGSDGGEVEVRIALSEGRGERAGGEHVCLVLHGASVAAVADTLLPRDAAPPPRLHLQAVGLQAQAAEGLSYEVWDVFRRRIHWMY